MQERMHSISLNITVSMQANMSVMKVRDCDIAVQEQLQGLVQKI
jgi:hypothetical protein